MSTCRHDPSARRLPSRRPPQRPRGVGRPADRDERDVLLQLARGRARRRRVGQRGLPALRRQVRAHGGGRGLRLPSAGDADGRRDGERSWRTGAGACVRRALQGRGTGVRRVRGRAPRALPRDVRRARRGVPEGCARRRCDRRPLVAARRVTRRPRRRWAPPLGATARRRTEGLVGGPRVRVARARRAGLDAHRSRPRARLRTRPTTRCSRCR